MIPKAVFVPWPLCFPNAVLRNCHFQSPGELWKYRFPEHVEGLAQAQKPKFSHNSPSGSVAQLRTGQSLRGGGQALLYFSPSSNSALLTDGCSDLSTEAARNPLASKIHLPICIYTINLYRSCCHTPNPNCPFPKLGIRHVIMDWTRLSSRWQLDPPLPPQCIPGPSAPYLPAITPGMTPALELM